MSTSSKIYVISADDANIHLEHLRNILNQFVQEKRIESFSFFQSSKFNESLLGNLTKDDMVLTLLTEELENNKSSIEQSLLNIKNEKGVSVAEVIIDKVPYEPQFLAFPQTLVPISASDNIQQVWKDIRESLEAIFPTHPDKPVAPAINWKKILPYILGAIILLLLLFIWKPWQTDKNIIEEKATEVVANSSLASILTETMACPETLLFQGEIAVSQPDTVEYYWERSGGIKSETQRLIFDDTISKSVKSEWTLGSPGESVEGWHRLVITSPVNLETEKLDFKFNCKSVSQPSTGPPLNVSTSVEHKGGRTISSSKCPVRIEFFGKISTNRPATIKYTWLRNDGSTEPIKNLTFNGAETKSVDSYWQLGGAGKKYQDYWKQLKIILPDGREVFSNKAIFNLQCTSGVASLVIEDIFTITGRGTVVTGRVRGGNISVGDELKVLQTGDSFKCTGIEMNRRQVTEATEGDAVGILLRGARVANLQKGYTLQAYVASARDNQQVAINLLDVGPNRLDIIKLVRDITGLGLKESKKLVDNVPSIITKGTSIKEAEKIKQIFERAGARVAFIN